METMEKMLSRSSGQYEELGSKNDRVVKGDVVTGNQCEDGVEHGQSTKDEIKTTPRAAPTRVDPRLNPLIEGPLAGIDYFEYELDDVGAFGTVCRIPGPDPKTPCLMHLFCARDKRSFRLFQEVGPSPESWRYIFSIKRIATSLRTTAQELWVLDNEVLGRCAGGLKIYRSSHAHTTEYRITTLQNVSRELVSGSITAVGGQPMLSRSSVALMRKDGTLPYPYEPKRKLRVFQSSSHEDVLTRKPQWNPARGRFELEFGRRVRLLHSSNIQLVMQSSPDVVAVQFGKCAKREYILDYAAPLTVVQAVGMAIAHWSVSRRKIMN